MQFKYKKYASSLLRPVIPIYIKSGDEIVGYEMLVDSGADMNIVNAEIAEVLGIDLKSTKITGTFSGATGTPETCYIHPVVIKVGGHEHSVDIAFAQKVGFDGYGVLGQKGFFDLYKVSFDYAKERIELKAHRRSG